ncbi:hypothetical protein [Pseudomonas putida]|uniref:Uncharacterized protein n=1 Tax=Pseudomonas putida TaxID=303 RepID=A0A6I6XF28_PSEPU|nr:hypothetical protein [Pseudomonas putida]QHG63926.1 hypothetical protein C2H86_05605 [Pseudomonas putida]
MGHQSDNQDNSVVLVSGLKEPDIPLRNKKKEIDLDALGGNDLRTVIKYTGMEEGDLVKTLWLGANNDGEPFDTEGTYPVHRDDLANGLVVSIGNATVVAAKGGEAFYSYTVTPLSPSGRSSSLISRRSFCFIGVRPEENNESLQVILGLESHDLVIKPKELEAAGVTFIVAPYQAMKIGDEITFTLQGFDEDDYRETPIIEKLRVTKEHLAKKALAFTIGKNIFLMIDQGRAEVSYRIDFVDGKDAESPVQNFIINSAASLPGFLPDPSIVGHIPGVPLNPGKFRDGLTVTVNGYPGMQISDCIALRWRSPVRDLLQTIRVDASVQVVGGIAFHVPVDYLLENQGLNVYLSCLFAREGAGQCSQELTVSIETPRELSAPEVLAATPDTEMGTGRGTLLAKDALGGVWVEVADVLLPGERAEVHWRGWPEYGEYEAPEPAGSNPRRFFIPERFVPANMGRGAVDENRRFEVVYVVHSKDGPLESAPYNLRIKPPPSNEYPTVQCAQVRAGQLSLAEVPGGADLELGTWYFGKAGDLIQLQVTGVTPTGVLDEIIRDASEPVTEAEAKEGIKARLALSTLNKLSLDEAFTVHARLSFDGGVYYTSFGALRPVLRK